MARPSTSLRTNGEGAAPEGERSRSPVPWLAAAVLLFAVSLAARWPGVAMYDSVAQYGQALEGAYTDWHPPIMARVWALLNRIHGGTQPFFLIQMSLWWGGLCLLAAGLGRVQRHGAAAAVLAVGLCPLWLGWGTVVLKDAQMAACLLAAAGLVGWWWLQDRAVPRPAWAAITLLIGYATLVRGNAVFATVPLAVAFMGTNGRWRIASILGGIAAVILLSPVTNRALLGAEPSHVEKALLVYDIAGIAHHAGLATVPGVAPGQWAAAERQGCYTPFFWNPYGEPAQCDALGRAIAGDDGARPGLGRAWLGLIVRHPIAYAMHRIGHLNANLRFWVGAGEAEALPPLRSEPNTLGLGAPPGPAARELIDLAGWTALSPIGWPVTWLAVALGLLFAGERGRRDGQVRLGHALALSAAVMGASFGVVSMASDLRYHLWTMLAAALALILMVDARALDRRRAIIAGSAVIALIALGTVARLGAAPPVYIPRPHVVPPPGS